MKLKKLLSLTKTSPKKYQNINADTLRKYIVNYFKFFDSKSLTIICLLIILINPSSLNAQGNNSKSLDKNNRAAIINRVADLMKQAYIYEDVGNSLSQDLKIKLNNKVYDKFDNIEMLCRKLTQDLIAQSKDEHLRITPLRKNSSNKPNIEVKKRLVEEMRLRNYGFNKVEIKIGGIGYVDLREFADPKLAGLTTKSTMLFLENSEALIIDLRNNGGGSSQMVQLLSSYLFKSPVHLTTHFTRIDDSYRELWSHYIDGPDLSEIPVFILLSKDSFSAAEAFAYHLQALNRATIVGEVSSGAAHPVRYFDEPELGITIKISVGRNINPITGTDWEKVGVIPDIEIKAKKAIEAASAAALDSLIEKTENKSRIDLLRFYQKKYKGKTKPAILSDSCFQEYLGLYESNRYGIEIKLKKGELYALLYGGRVKFPMTPLEKDKFEATENYIIELVRNESDKIISMTVNYINSGEVFKDILKRKE